MLRSLAQIYVDLVFLAKGLELSLRDGRGTFDPVGMPAKNRFLTQKQGRDADGQMS